MTNFVTPAEVDTSFGVTVTEDEITQAQNVIEDLLGNPISVDNNYSDRDTYLLQRAIMWEVTYLKANPGVLNAVSNLSSASTNGVSVSYVAGASGAGFIAPMAAKVLRKLSWNRRTKTVFLNSSHSNRNRYQTLIEDEGYPLWKKL